MRTFMPLGTENVQPDFRSVLLCKIVIKFVSVRYLFGWFGPTSRTGCVKASIFSKEKSTKKSCREYLW